LNINQSVNIRINIRAASDPYINKAVPGIARVEAGPERTGEVVSSIIELTVTVSSEKLNSPIFISGNSKIPVINGVNSIISLLPVMRCSRVIL
jgi:hypothetical protein